jgi:hypothetical protein
VTLIPDSTPLLLPLPPSSSSPTFNIR